MKGFSLIELLIVLAVIAAIISALVPLGVNVIRHARALTVAFNLSEISKAAMSNFYLDHNTSISIDSIKSYFSQREELKDYQIKSSLASTLEHVYIWYTGNDVTASQVEKVFPDVEATRGNKPMISIELRKYW